EAEGDPHEKGREEGQADGGEGAGDEGPDGGGGEGGRPAAPTRHAIALQRGDDRGGFAGSIDEDGGGRAAVHRAVVDAGEHDEAAGGRELVGRGQQQGARERGPDAGKHADRGAEERPEEGEQEVRGGERDAEAVAERGESVHPLSRYG